MGAYSGFQSPLHRLNISSIVNVQPCLRQCAPTARTFSGVHLPWKRFSNVPQPSFVSVSAVATPKPPSAIDPVCTTCAADAIPAHTATTAKKSNRFTAFLLTNH